MPIIRIPRDARILRELLFDFLKDLPPTFPPTITYQPTTVRVSDLDETYRLMIITLDWDGVKVKATVAVYGKSNSHPRGKRKIRELKLTSGRKVSIFDANAVAHLPPW